MKKEDLFTLLGEVDEQYAAEALNADSHTKKSPWLKWGAMAACLCLVIIGAYLTQNNVYIQKEPGIKQHDINGSEVEQETNLPAEQTTDANKDPEPSDAEDRPADEGGVYHENHTHEFSPKMADIFCGSYADSKGQLVVILMEDTPQNRSTACKELGIKEDLVSFQTGTYSFRYLTELQKKISEGMIEKEFPFVVASSINTIRNRITIHVTTKDKTLLKNVLALDTIGGAIEIQFSEGGKGPLLE